MSDAKPNPLESLLSRLRASGVPESDLQSLAAKLHALSPAETEYVCLACGHSSETSIRFTIAGEPLPTRWVYCYRGDHHPLGLCNLCFGLRRFDGFTDGEIAYFRESFEEIDET